MPLSLNYRINFRADKKENQKRVRWVLNPLNLTLITISKCAALKSCRRTSVSPSSPLSLFTRLSLPLLCISRQECKQTITTHTHTLECTCTHTHTDTDTLSHTGTRKLSVSQSHLIAFQCKMLRAISDADVDVAVAVAAAFACSR